MTEPTISNLPNGLVELKFTISPIEVQPFLDQAAADLQQAKPIQGFRPGKAPYDEVKKVFGEMRIWETALERIVRARYVQAVLQSGVDAIGSPAISVEQLVPGEEIRFTATVPVMPSVVALAEYEKPLVTKKTRTIDDKEVAAAIEDIRKMRRTEVVADRASAREDMVSIDLEIKRDGVVIEGGTAKNYRIYLNEPQYVAGFADQLVGVKKGDVKSFDLTFPADHYQKHLAGKTVTFGVTVNDVYALALPTLDDEFAKGIGAESLEKLRALLHENLTKEAEHKADEAAEIEMLEKLVSGSKFSAVPELLVNEEVRRMFAELEHAAEQQGMKMADYLSQLKKSADQIKLDLVPQAIKRVQTAVVIKDISKKEKVEVSEDEIDTELDRILEKLQDKEAKERVSSPDYRDYLSAQMKNRKTLEILKKKAIEAK